MAGAQVAVAVTALEEQRKGYNGISLTNYNSQTLDAAIAQGSVVELGGALFEFSTDETLTGFAGLGNRSRAFLELTVSGSSITGAWTATVPTWDDDKQGWYTTTKRVVATAWKDGSGNQTNKRLLFGQDLRQVATLIDINGANHTMTAFDRAVAVTTGASDRTITLDAVADHVGNEILVIKDDTGVGGVIVDGAGIETIAGIATRQLNHAGASIILVGAVDEWKIRSGEFQTQRLDIGDWNMNRTAAGSITVNVNHDIGTAERIVKWDALIRNDADTLYFNVNSIAATGENKAALQSVTDTQIQMEVMAGFGFDNTNFDSTAYNRGWVTLVYDSNPTP